MTAACSSDLIRVPFRHICPFCLLTTLRGPRKFVNASDICGPPLLSPHLELQLDITILKPMSY
jgi:hypothetical protein